jgi:hypothetical protein
VCRIAAIAKVVLQITSEVLYFLMNTINWGWADEMVENCFLHLSQSYAM